MGGSIRNAMVSAIAVILALTTPAGATPANDSFGSAKHVAAVPFSELGDLTDATREAGEPWPSCAFDEPTIWYRLEVSAPAVLAATTTGSDIDSFVAIFSGSSLNELNEVACGSDPEVEGGAYASVLALPGTTYFFQVGAIIPQPGAVRFSVSYGAAAGLRTGIGRVAAGGALGADRSDGRAGAATSFAGVFASEHGDDSGPQARVCMGVHSMNCATVPAAAPTPRGGSR